MIIIGYDVKQRTTYILRQVHDLHFREIQITPASISEVMLDFRDKNHIESYVESLF